MTALSEGLARYLSSEQRALLASQRIGIAGLGGIGSNVAILLARTGVQNLVLIDDDFVDASNLNRQNYDPDDVGKRKTTASLEKLKKLNPEINADILTLRITDKNIAGLIEKADLWVEALDNAQEKAMFAQATLLGNKTVVCASGIAGFGGKPLLWNKIGNMIVVGDGTTDIKNAPPLAPRVMWAAAMMADTVITLLLDPSRLCESRKASTRTSHGPCHDNADLQL